MHPGTLKSRVHVTRPGRSWREPPIRTSLYARLMASLAAGGLWGGDPQMLPFFRALDVRTGDRGCPAALQDSFLHWLKSARGNPGPRLHCRSRAITHDSFHESQ